jgi:hypothetical protein
MDSARRQRLMNFTVTIGLLVRNEDRDQPIIVLSKFAQSLAQAGIQPTPPRFEIEKISGMEYVIFACPKSGRHLIIDLLLG